MAKKSKSSGSSSSSTKSYPNDKGPAGNTAPTTSPFAPSGANHPIVANAQANAPASSFKQAGAVLSQSELQAIAKAKGLTPEQVMSKALDKGIGIGSKVVNDYNRPGALGTYVYQGTPGNLDPLKGLTLGKGTAYYGASTYTTPGGNMPDGQRWSGSTTYNPIVLPRGGYGGTAAGQGGGAGGNGGTSGDGTGDGTVKNDGSIDSIKALYDQQMADARAEFDKYAQMQAEQINTMQLDFGNQIAEIQSAADMRVSELSDLMMFQQQQAQSTQGLLQQQAMAAERAYQEQARVASALGTAYVPDVEKSAATVALGDQRSTQSEKQQSSLSDLAIVSGLGTNSNPLAGLQLA